MMAKREKTPSVGLRKTPGILHRGIDTVECLIEEATPGRFGSGAVWKSRLENQRQLFHDESPFRKASGLLIGIEITRFHVDVVEFGKTGLPPFSPLGVSGPPTNTQLRKPVGNF